MSKRAIKEPENQSEHHLEEESRSQVKQNVPSQKKRRKVNEDYKLIINDICIRTEMEKWRLSPIYREEFHKHDLICFNIIDTTSPATKAREVFKDHWKLIVRTIERLTYNPPEKQLTSDSTSTSDQNIDQDGNFGVVRRYTKKIVKDVNHVEKLCEVIKMERLKLRTSGDVKWKKQVLNLLKILGERTLKCSKYVFNQMNQVSKNDDQRFLDHEIDAIISMSELDLEFSILEVSGSPSSLEPTRYLGNKNRIANMLKTILNFIKKNYSGSLELFRRIKVYGVQIYNHFFYVYSLCMPFAGVYYFKLEMCFPYPIITLLLFKELPIFASNLWVMRDMIISSTEDIKAYITSESDSESDAAHGNFGILLAELEISRLSIENIESRATIVNLNNKIEKLESDKNERFKDGVKSTSGQLTEIIQQLHEVTNSLNSLMDYNHRRNSENSNSLLDQPNIEDDYVENECYQYISKTSQELTIYREKPKALLTINESNEELEEKNSRQKLVNEETYWGQKYKSRIPVKNLTKYLISSSNNNDGSNDELCLVSKPSVNLENEDVVTRKSTRTRCDVNYAEPSLRSKLRQGDPFTYSLEETKYSNLGNTPKQKRRKKTTNNKRDIQRKALSNITNAQLNEQSISLMNTQLWLTLENISKTSVFNDLRRIKIKINDSSNKPDVELQEAIGNDDYAFAMLLQQMHDMKRAEGNNLTFEHHEEISSNNDKSKKESEKEKISQKGANYFDDYYFDDYNFDDYYFDDYNFDDYYFDDYYFDDYYFDSPSPYKALKNQQNNNKPDHFVHNNSQYDNFPRGNSQYDNFARSNSQYDNSAHNNNQSDFFTRGNDNFTRSNNDNFTRSNNDNFTRSNDQFDNFTRNTNDFSQRRTKFNPSGKAPREFRILLLGGTGTGKSTIINTVTNYFLSGTLDEPKIVIPSKYYKVTEKEFANEHSEAKLDDVTKSQTTKCYNYNFEHPNNSAYKFIFIDTPGLSDTKGVKQDDKNIQEITDAAISAGTLSAIVIIANGTEARVTPSIKNTLVRLANNLPDAVIGNLLLILTKCAKSSACFSEPSFSKEIAKPKHIFYMDNQAFCTDPQIWKNDFEERVTVQHHWDKSIRTIDNLLEAITEMSATSTQAFAKMKEYRDKIKSEILKVTQDIANIQKVQDSLDASQKALQISGNKKNSFANYTKNESIELKKIVPVNYHSTVCTLHLKDDVICHEDCGLEFKNTSGTDHFGGCPCMGPNKICRICGCGPTNHFHDKIKLIKETKTIAKVIEDMKAQYDNANQQEQKYSNDANQYKSTLSNLQATADAKYKHIHQLCTELSKICSRFNFVDELHANIENMKQDARTLQNTNLRKNAETEIQKLEKLANDLSKS
ncbi:5684_t:CDS:10 [Diversispora eburnea]|uniref:5684_t:CDS:1 n=1 Tax=Diversispora eburnea TaxID=1213867 RepID=A0A9N8YHS2_9GLOM|nr:5684_t:CDS:10 [Diversispora eburnea]